MELVNETVSIPKNLKNLKDLLVVIATDIKAKKPAAQIASDSLGQFAGVIEGASSLGDEVKSPQAILLGVLALGQIAAVFMNSSAVASTAAQA